jgi:hypothetical protein
MFFLSRWLIVGDDVFIAPNESLRVITVFRLLTDFVCVYTYEFWLCLCKIVLFKSQWPLPHLAEVALRQGVWGKWCKILHSCNFLALKMIPRKPNFHEQQVTFWGSYAPVCQWPSLLTFGNKHLIKR